MAAPRSPAAGLARRAVASWRRRRGTTPPAPDRTGFYRAGPPGDGARGEVLAIETIEAPPGARAWRTRYRTLDGAGRPVAASMAVATPQDQGGATRPTVLWVHGAVGVAPGCAPSRSGFQAWYAEEWLARGIAVAAPDLTGLGVEGVTHPYLHGTTAGRSVLDAARAAAGLTGAGGPVAVLGHSAGGHAVLWADELAAGEDGAGLEVTLAVALAPVGDLGVAMTSYASARDQAAFPVQLAATWPGVEPVDAAEVLTGAARERLGHLHRDRLERLVRVFGGDPARWVRVGGFASPPWAAALARQSPGAERAAAPVLLGYGEADGAVPVTWAGPLRDRLASAGTAVDLRTWPGADHMGVAGAARDEVVRLVLDAVGR